MKFIDIFAGTGGFRKGMEAVGHKCIGFCEYDKYAVASYTAMHLLTQEQQDYIQSISAPLKKNGEPNLRKRQQEILKEEYRNEWFANDIRAVNARDIPKADCWCFGFPCQDVSIAGKQAGLSGRRSGLFYAVTGLIRELPEENRPRYLFIENVKNLLSVNRGYDFLSILSEMDEIGYDAEWEVLNSKDFGVPQNRERVFIIGHLRGRSTRKVFPLRETSGIHNTAKQVKQIGNCMPTATRDNPNQGRIYDLEGIAPCINKMDGGGRVPFIPISMTRKECKAINIANTLTAGTPDKKRGNYSPVTGVAIPVLAPERKEKKQNGRRFKENGEPMFTLTGQDRHGVMIPKNNDRISEQAVTVAVANKGKPGDIVEVFHNKVNNSGICPSLTTRPEGLKTALCPITKDIRIRKLTPKECFRLQGWEDTYFHRAAMVNSDSQLYKQAGNGVTVNVIQAIAERME